MAAEFPEKLRQEMDRRGLTVYRLARLIDPKNPWAAERNLYRWLSETNPRRPSQASLAALTRALGLPPDFFVMPRIDPLLGTRVVVGESFVEGVERRLAAGLRGEPWA